MERGWVLFWTVIVLAMVIFLPKIISAISQILLGEPVKVWFAIYLLYLALALPTVSFLLVYFLLAPNNCFYTFVKEASAKIVVKADKFEKCLIQWEGHTFDYQKDHPEKWNVIKEDEEHKEPWHPFGGLRFYGFWPLFDIYIYKFRWTGVTEEGEVQHKERWLDYTLLRDDVYLFKVEKCEDKNLLPLDLEILSTIRVINPYKAHFAIQNWLETVINRVKPFIRGYITKDEFANWIKVKEALGEKLLKEFEESKLLEDFKDRYGIEVRKLDVKEINPPAEYREKILAPYLAKMEKEATVIKAEAQREKLRIEATGEEARIDTVYKKIQQFGDLGELVRALEAMERSPLAASVTVQAIPGIQEILRGVFGKPPQEISPEEFCELREIVKKLIEKKRKEVEK